MKTLKIIMVWSMIFAGGLSAAGKDFDLQYVPASEDECETLTQEMLSSGIEIAYRSESEKQKLWIFQPDDLQPDELRPCLFFIHGGGWGGFANAFAPQCLYFSRRGMVTVSIHFRGPKEPKGAGTPKTCLADARSAYRWIREHAKEYNIDPDLSLIHI